MVGGGGVSDQGGLYHHYGNVRAVRILLECILVFFYFCNCATWTLNWIFYKPILYTGSDVTFNFVLTQTNS